MKGKSARIILCLLLLVLFIVNNALGASKNKRGVKVAPKAPPSFSELYNNSYAVIIGINNYEKWPSLEYAVNDAKSIENKLKTLGFETKILLDHNATRGNILKLLGDDLPRRVSKNDRVLIFFAGHGQTEELPDGTQMGYIVPVDADTRDLFSTAISMDQVRNFSKRLKAKHVLYLMDSCYSGLGLSRSGAIPASEQDYLRKITTRKAHQMLTAGGKGEQAKEEGAHGLFTKYVMEAFDGQADRDEKGYITFSDLASYVKPKVSRDTGNTQTPQYGNIDGEGEFVFELDSKVRYSGGKDATAIAEEKQKSALEKQRYEEERGKLAQEKMRLDEERRRLEQESQDLNKYRLPQSTATVKVGIVLPLTGAEAKFGEIEKRSFEMAVDEINKQGGINGRKMELIVEDDTGRPELGRSVAEKLINKDKVVMLGGGYSSSVAYAVAGVAQQNRIPFLVNTASADLITASGWDFVFRLNPPVSEYAGAIESLLTEVVKPQTVVILHENSLFGKSGAKPFEETCTKLGYKVLLKQEYEAGGIDFKPVLVRVKQLNPDIIYMVSYIMDASLLMKQAKELKLTPRMFVGGAAGFTMPEFRKNAGDASEKVISAALWHQSLKYPGAMQVFGELRASVGDDTNITVRRAYRHAQIVG